MIQHAEVIKDTVRDIAEIGSTVTWQSLDQNETETYTIVGPEEVDPNEGTISYNAPIAKQLLQAKVGNKRTLTTPAGNRQVKIIEIS